MTQRALAIEPVRINRAAQLIGVSRSTLNRWIKADKITRYPMGARMTFVDLAQVRAVIEEGME